MSISAQIRSNAIVAIMNAATTVYENHADAVGINDTLEVPFDVTTPRLSQDNPEGFNTEVKSYKAVFSRPDKSETGLTYAPTHMTVNMDLVDFRLHVCDGEASIWADGFSHTQPLYTFILQDVNGELSWALVGQWSEQRFAQVEHPPVYLRHLLSNLLIGIENVVSRQYPEIGQERFLTDLLGSPDGKFFEGSTLRSTPEAMQAYHEVFTEFNQHLGPDGQLKLADPEYLEGIWAGWISRLKPHFPTVQSITVENGVATLEA